MSDVGPARRDTLDAIVIPTEVLERSVPKQRYDPGRSPDLTIPLFVLVGLPAIAIVGAVIGYALSVL